MHSDEHRRLHAVCLTMAQQSNLPDLRARWLALAMGYEDLYEDLLWGSGASERQSKRHRVQHVSRHHAPEHAASR
jgi:hypothetical protein